MDKEKGSGTKLVSFTRSRYVPIKRKSLHRYVKSHTVGATRKKSTSSTYDPCGLSGNYDVFSDDDALKYKNVKHFGNKFIKSQLLANKITKEEIQHKFELINQENAKVQIKMKSLFKNILKKEKIINELNKTNEHLKQRLQATAENTTIRNTDLIELANANSRLQKDIEKKKEDITALQTKINKSEFIRSNLLKDIEFYKMELSAAKSESSSQQQKYSEYEYEKLQKKFYETKIENNKLCRKFKEIRSSDEESYPKAQSYHVLCKKLETVQHDLMKLKMENKTLKEKIRKNKQAFDDEISVATQNSVKLVNEELENLTQTKQKLEIENEHIKALLAEVQSEANSTKAILIDTQVQLQEKVSYCRQSDEEIKNFNLLCNDLQHQLKSIKTEKEAILKQHGVNEETNNMLKLKIDELMRERSEFLTQKININNADEEHCENCTLLRYEVEKLGYANLRLQKEKQNLQTNFQKLSIKTSKLTLRMEELEHQKQLVNQRREDHGTDESLMQQNVLLSKRLHNLLKKSEKLFKIHVQQSTISEKDIMSPLTSNDKIIEELNENLSFSKSNLEMIENKLNAEEWKLNAALKHIRQVKEQIKIET